MIFPKMNSDKYQSMPKLSNDTILLFSDILCIQEHFLLDSQDKKYSNTNKIRNKFGKDFDMFIVPAVKDNSQVTKGRGKGGLATLWTKVSQNMSPKLNAIISGFRGPNLHSLVDLFLF